jgi:hypothetical protein
VHDVVGDYFFAVWSLFIICLIRIYFLRLLIIM